MKSCCESSRTLAQVEHRIALLDLGREGDGVGILLRPSDSLRCNLLNGFANGVCGNGCDPPRKLDNILSRPDRNSLHEGEGPCIHFLLDAHDGNAGLCLGVENRAGKRSSTAVFGE